jgi:hypothetical protein
VLAEHSLTLVLLTLPQDDRSVLIVFELSPTGQQLPKNLKNIGSKVSILFDSSLPGLWCISIASPLMRTLL